MKKVIYDNTEYNADNFPKNLTEGMRIEQQYDVICKIFEEGQESWCYSSCKEVCRLVTDGHIVRFDSRTDILGRLRYVPSFACGLQLALQDIAPCGLPDNAGVTAEVVNA